jgi:multimeric flavodoxin WrbA
MNAGKHIVAINGSYREGGVTDQLLAAMAEELEARGSSLDIVKLRDEPINFCLNCRECMQQPGETPGRCVLNDGMQSIIERLESADGFVLSAPTNFSSVTALFKRFSERLAPYGYWPWGTMAPRFRKDGLEQKPAVLVSSCAAPGLLGQFSFMTLRELKIASRTLGARVKGSLLIGFASGEREAWLRGRTLRRARRLARRLV